MIRSPEIEQKVRTIILNNSNNRTHFTKKKDKENDLEMLDV